MDWTRLSTAHNQKESILNQNIALFIFENQCWIRPGFKIKIHNVNTSILYNLGAFKGIIMNGQTC